MPPDPLRAALERFAADLTVAGQPAVLDRAVERHLPTFQQALAAGLRWPAIARLLAQMGARRPNGGGLSSDQLRASFSRATRRGHVAPATGPSPSTLHATARGEPRVMPIHDQDSSESTTRPSTHSAKDETGPRRGERAPPVIGAVREPGTRVDDLTDADVQAARTRLSRL